MNVISRSSVERTPQRPGARARGRALHTARGRASARGAPPAHVAQAATQDRSSKLRVSRGTWGHALSRRVNTCDVLKGKTRDPWSHAATRNHTCYTAVHTYTLSEVSLSQSLCVCVSARGGGHAVPAIYKLRRQPYELGRAKPQRRGQGLVLRLLGDHRVREAYVCSRQGQSGRLFSAATDLLRLTGGWPKRASGWRPPCACSGPGGACWGATVLAAGYGPELLSTWRVALSARGGLAGRSGGR